MPTIDRPISIAATTKSARPTRATTTFRLASSLLERITRSSNAEPAHMATTIVTQTHSSPVVKESRVRCAFATLKCTLLIHASTWS